MESWSRKRLRFRLLYATNLVRSLALYALFSFVRFFFTTPGCGIRPILLFLERTHFSHRP